MEVQGQAKEGWQPSMLMKSSQQPPPGSEQRGPGDRADPSLQTLLFFERLSGMPLLSILETRVGPGWLLAASILVLAAIWLAACQLWGAGEWGGHTLHTHVPAAVPLWEPGSCPGWEIKADVRML
jgi:hypothetical protein